MQKIATLLFLATLVWVSAASAQTVTQPSGTITVASASDFATRAFQDPWDMNQRTDLGWFLHGTDAPASGFSAFTFAGGLFSGTIASDPNLFLLETGFVGAAPVGKIGTNYPIETSVYRRLAIRMRASQASAMHFFWSTNTIFDPPGLQTSSTIPTTAGWRIYFVDLASLTLLAGTETWTSTQFKRSLRLDPALDSATGTVDIDWIRLTNSDPGLFRNITWTPSSGGFDIYVSQGTPTTNNPDALPGGGLVASNQSGGTYSLYVGALAPGDYHVAMRPAGSTANFIYSSGFYRVNAPPTVTVTAPSPEGSSDDFATTQFNNPWDMNSLSDIDLTFNVTGGTISTVAAAETPEGTALGDITAFRGTSTTGIFGGQCASVGDPIVYPLNQSVRGFNARIDPTRYRILTAELGLGNLARNICDGSVVRVVWHIDGEAQENVSDDIVLDSRAGANVLNTINVDMAALPVDPASPAITGWTGSIKSFRLDPHEFANPTPFYIKRIKLAALETADTSYVVRWTSSEASGTVNVYYDTDKDPTVKSFINSTAVSATTGSLTWNTSALGSGQQYYVYVEFDDGTNTNGAYGKWPVRIDHSATAPRIVVSRPTLNFGVTALTTRTGTQTVRVTVVGSGSPCWTVDNSLPTVFTVTGGSGCGSGEFTVSLVNQNYNVLGVGEGTLTVRQVTPGTIDNSPQHVHAWIRIHGATGAPFGTVDTPVDGSVVSGSIAVTGWALDDIDITGVTVYRDPVAGEGGSRIFVGNAVRIDDARPDVEGLTGSTPFQYRAGWGFLVLTNFLPNGGDGTYVLRVYATDREGHETLLGSRTIVGANASSLRPFGAIDTPAQGETISGTSYDNFGWVLGRVGVSASPALGGSVSVVIDGVVVGSPCCWGARSDLTTLFPASTYPGVNVALGVYPFNPSLLTNGLHTIAWGVTATNGQQDGVGSRFFNVINSSVVASAASRPNVITARAEINPGRSLGMATLAFAQTTPARFVTARAGTRVAIEAAGLEGSAPYEAYLSVAGILRPLPIGSAFDERRGAFYWQPGPGFAGSYDLMFVRDGKRLPVHVTLTPGASTHRPVHSPFSALFTDPSS